MMLGLRYSASVVAVTSTKAKAGDGRPIVIPDDNFREGVVVIDAGR